MNDRVPPPLLAGEAEMLTAYLDQQRATLRRQVSGLDAEQLGRTLAPSTMTLGGLVSHLTYVEDWWFSVVLFDNPPAAPWDSVDWGADPDRDWHVAAGRSGEDLLTSFEEAVGRSDRCIAAALEAGGLDALSVREGRRQGSGPFSLRWILLHMIEEYARHLGHADLLRESVDGEVGL